MTDLLCLPQWWHSGSGPGSGQRGHGRLITDGAAEQRRLLPAPRGVRLVRRSLRAMHHAAAREQAQGPGRLSERRRELASPSALQLQKRKR